MSSYPRLSRMGVENPQHIAGFSINSIDYTDYLRITYERPKGSLLAYSRTYKFPRQQTKKESAKGGAAIKSSAEFREAVDELQQIVKSRKGAPENVQAILDELHKLEEDFAIRCANLRALIRNSG